MLGANGLIRIDFIDVSNRGWKLLRSIMLHDNVEVGALCDIYEPYLHRDSSKVDKRLIKELGGKIPPVGKYEMFKGNVNRYKDFSKLLEWNEIDVYVFRTF